jgi:hypothetical protein
LNSIPIDKESYLVFPNLGIKWRANDQEKSVGGKLLLFKKKTIGLQKTCKDFLFVFSPKKLPLFCYKKKRGKT